MKNIIYFFSMLIFTLIISSCARKTVVVHDKHSHNHIAVVQKAPPSPKSVKSKRCGPNKTWVKGHWVWNGAKYNWKNGYCQRKQKGKKWVSGHWKKTSHGWKWTAGRWR